MSDGVEEAILFRQQAWWHAWEEGEGEKGEMVGQSHCSTNGREGGMIRRHIVVPGNEAINVSEVSALRNG